MKILIVNDYFWPKVGGVEYLGKLMMEGLEKEGHEVKILTIDKNRKNRRFSEIKTSRLGWVAGCKFYTKKTIKDFNPDIVHALNHTSFGAAYAARAMGVPAVTTGHEFLGKQWNRLVGWWEALMYKTIEKLQINAPFNRIVVPSISTYNAAKKLGVAEEKLVLIPNLVDSTPYKEYKWKGGNHFLFFGRLGKTKGVDLVAGAAKKMPDEEFKLILSGPEKEIRQFKANVGAGQMKNMIIEKSKPIEKLFEEIENCKAVIIPSRSEGFGYAAIDACMIGAPVIANIAGSLPEVVFGKVLRFNGTIPDLIKKLKLANANKFSRIRKPKFINLKNNMKKLISFYESIYAKDGK